MAESAKLDMFPMAPPRNVGPFVAFASCEQKRDVLNRYNLVPNDYFIVNAGSGGHSVNNLNCADVYFEAALKITKLTGLKGVVVFGPNYNKFIPKSNELICLTSLQNPVFLALMSDAKIALLSAGDTLVHTPTVACAISKDQHSRLSSCEKTGVVFKADLNIDSIVSKVEQVVNDPFYDELINKYAQLENVHSFDVITQGVKSMLLGSHS